MWNAKVRCYNNIGGGFEENEIVEIKNGEIRLNIGHIPSKKFNSIEELNGYFTSKFELVSEELPQPHKSLLKDGDYAITRNGCSHIVSIKFNVLIDSNRRFIKISGMSDELYANVYNDNDVMEIYRDGKLIAKRTEKSKEQIELEEIEERLEEIPQAIVKMLKEQTELMKKRSELKERLK